MSKEIPRVGDILESLCSSSTGSGWYEEQDTIKGREYKCLDVYPSNDGGTCVVIDSESGRLGMGFEGYFKIKKKAEYIQETRKINVELTIKINCPTEKHSEENFEKIVDSAINSLWQKGYKEYQFISGKILKEDAK